MLRLPDYIQLVTYVLYISWKKVYVENSGLYCRWTHCLKFQKYWKTKIINWRGGSRYKILLHLISGAFTSQVKIHTQCTPIWILEYLLKLCSHLHSHWSNSTVKRSFITGVFFLPYAFSLVQLCSQTIKTPQNRIFSLI